MHIALPYLWIRHMLQVIQVMPLADDFVDAVPQLELRRVATGGALHSPVAHQVTNLELDVKAPKVMKVLVDPLNTP